MKLSDLPVMYALAEFNKKREKEIFKDNFQIENWKTGISKLHGTNLYELNNYFKPISLKINIDGFNMNNDF